MRVQRAAAVVLYFSILALSSFFALGLANNPDDVEAQLSEHERDYIRLYDATEEKDALEAIRDLHRHLDDDKDGAIEPSETTDFIKADLQYGSDKQRQKNFHRKDDEITVSDLWMTWRKSEVYNWTVDHVVDWLKQSVQLPQYAEKFIEAKVNGTHLPKAAVSTSFLSKTLGITNPIHRSKINLKAMDVVLFGAPKDQNSFLKDVVLTTLLLVAFTGLLYAYRQNKRSQEHLRRMMHDMDSLAKAEQTLVELQEKLQQKDAQLEMETSSTPSDGNQDMVEVSRLKEELELLRSELHRAEVELEDKCWIAPPVLQHWLQLTYELESATYNAKKKAAEEQLELAKDMCERLKRKRSSLVGAFVSTHGRSIDDVDRSILEAKTALVDLTKDLTERTQRWRQIEMLCGVSIVNNPGIPVLQNLIRHVGIGRSNHGLRIGSTRLSNSVSQEDLLEDIDAHSVAASSTHLTTASSHVSRTTNNQLLASALTMQQTKKRADLKSLSRESSKESSSSDEHVSDLQIPNPSISTRSSVASSFTRASTPPISKVASASPAAFKRSKMMVKSRSQDGGGSMQEAANLVGQKSNGSGRGSVTSSMTSSISEGQLQPQHQPDRTSVSSASSLSGMKASSSNLQLSKPSIVEELDESSDSGSITSLDKKKKKRSFFTFGRKKEKKDVK